jgi:hypothetical protein
MAAAGKNDFDLNLRAGELVEVRSKEEILATLDEKGRLDGLPFMPEMLQYCGKQVRVYKRAHKTCDTVDKKGGRQLPRTVHLEGLRCGGEAHGGCQAACLMFWKDAWLKRVPVDSESHSATPAKIVKRKGKKCSEDALWRNTTRSIKAPANETPETPEATEAYVCQTTEILSFTTHLPWWDIRQYMKDVTSRNVKVIEVVRAGLFRLFLLTLQIGGYRALTYSYDHIQRMRGSAPYPFREGKATSKTPSERLNLQPGEMVRVKSYEEILETINKVGKNRGMRFDAEMVQYCGKIFRVLARVDRIIDEKTGVMRNLPNDCIILEDVICAGQLTKLRLFCPTASYAYWREIWLRRVGPAPHAGAQHDLNAESRNQSASELQVCR